ncbi:alpha-actinin-2 [Anaeramoeba ignava]|uniref:Alpha-actinin-2 n=1 Tax=Anaeramoeba ignava TaxID=1746090 RepID=A0A9Q0RBN2_ANAIG|nr:alpha-actinin-2 [Anaeramoeba ignava]
MSRTGRRTGGGNQDWVRLQRKIFSRWVKQKLLRTRPEIQVNDVVEDIKDGVLLINLIEVLSETQYDGKYVTKPKMSIHRIDNLNNGLKFAWSQGVDMKVKPSAEQLEKGDVRGTLALVWAIMMKYIKIDDGSGGEALNAKDALLMWCKNKTAGYDGVEINDFKKSFADGTALCAIIHKHRPKLIEWENLDPSNPIQNLETAQDAAERYFALEKYITPDEIRRLDENSMVVYVSEYYYGIAEQRKLDLAARRLKKLIILTKENDRLKAEYNATAKNFKATLKRVEKILEDRTIDNTMAGARKRLDLFYDYKAKDKSSLLSDQLNLESNYNNLAMRLAHHKRPEFKPEKGCSLKEVAQDMVHLEECEKEREVALHAELNRQLKLQQMAQQHSVRHQKLLQFAKEKEGDLRNKEESFSVSEAQLKIKILDSTEKENASIKSTGVQYLKRITDVLVKEKYEHSQKILTDQKQIDDYFVLLDRLAKEKRPVLEGDLSREIEKERLRLEFANAVQDFLRYVQFQGENALVMEFGYTLSEVESYKKTLDSENQQIKTQAAKLKGACDSLQEELNSYNVTDNPYTTFTMEDVDQQLQDLENAIQQRNKAYDTELKRQQANDALCRKFADSVIPITKWILQQKDTITAAKTSLEDQLNYVDSAIANYSSSLSKIQPLKQLQAQMESAGIQNNPHTTVSLKDVTVLFEQYKNFITRKKQMLEEEIEHQKLRGITAEQMQEIEENFKQFDFDNSGTIDRKELTACLYSLGEERTPKEINKIMEEYGDGKDISYERFKDFMIVIFGDTDTKDEIINSFILINRGFKVAKKDLMELVMDDHDINYILSTAPKVDDGYDYHAWTEEVFSR